MHSPLHLATTTKKGMTKNFKTHRDSGGQLKAQPKCVVNLTPGVRGTDSHSTFFLIFPLCFFWFQREDVPTYQQRFGIPYFLSRNSLGSRPGAADVAWPGEPGAAAPATRESRTTHGTRSWQACCGWFPSPLRAARAAAAAAMAGTREPFLCLLR